MSKIVNEIPFDLFLFVAKLREWNTPDKNGNEPLLREAAEIIEQLTLRQLVRINVDIDLNLNSRETERYLRKLALWAIETADAIQADDLKGT